MVSLMDYIKATLRAFPEYTLQLEMFSSNNIVQYSRERVRTHTHTHTHGVFVLSFPEVGS